MDYHDHPFWTEQFDNDADRREADALVFTADDMADWTEDDFDSAELAMERDMEEREGVWQREALALRAELERMTDDK